MSLRLTNGETVTVTVTEAHPRPTKEGAKPKPLCIRNSSGALDVVLDLLPPLDALVDPVANNIIPPEVLERLAASMTMPEPPTNPHMQPLQPEVAEPVQQQAPPDREARRALMARAALARIGGGTQASSV